ncbi:MAG TPA: isoprenylcysteine carboxylmethyltransferase family protein [Pyrinomonadaceae bacterium]|jgi:protein-S-isoprenylcysteine O-methyltransferase Ste14|nr:isoprenylcysteine carboxylmethyltransferase family protein [Pyrinomonadaceae bacterium]
MTALKTILWSVFVPGTLTTLVPYLLLASRFELFPLELSVFRFAGLIPIACGAALYLWCAWDFTFSGRGTPAPFDPPKEIVLRGLYRYVRNPMYVAASLVLIGEAILFESVVILIYGAIVFSFFHLWVVFYEEPALRGKFGESYENYCLKVSRWIPRTGKARA